MEIVYNDEMHAYWIDGVRVPSITQAIKCATYDEFDHVNPALLKLRAAQGTSLAKAVEDYHFGRLDVTQYDPDILDDFDSFVEWVEKNRVKIVESEKIVASKRWMFAGRLDLVLRMPGLDGLAMVDIKRTAAPPASGGLQTAAQVLAYTETTGCAEKIVRYLLHIRDGRCTLVPQHNESDQKVFLAALTVTKWRIENGKHD